MEQIKFRLIITKSLWFFVVAAIIMFVYEYSKDLLIPELTIWKSHIITIAFVSFLSSILSYFYFLSLQLKKMYKKELDERLKFEEKLEQLNNTLENKVIERTNDILKLNEELKLAKSNAEEANNAKTIFLQNMSHEFRTPLNAIMGFSQLIEENCENNAELSSFALIIQNRSKDLLELINDILEVSRLESGKMPVNFEPINIASFLDEISHYYQHLCVRLNKHHLKFTIINECKNDTCIVSDRTKLKHVYTNLIHNALKFTHAGKIEIRCSLVSNVFIFRISDTGIGIDDDKINLIFERFIQIESGFTDITKGSGLGLSIVKGFIDLLDGEITVKSIKDEGTVFIVSIPDRAISSN